MSGGSAHDGELGAGEVAVPSQLVQTQLDPPRQQRRTPTQSDRRDRHDDLVQQPRVGELPGQVSPADDPDVQVTSGANHLLCTVATSALVNSIRESGTAGSCRCVNTQHRMSYGHVHCAGSLPATSCSRIHSYVVDPIAIAPTSAMNSP